MASTPAIFWTPSATRPNVTAGGVLHGSGVATGYQITAAGTAGQVIKSNGASDPTWGTEFTPLSDTSTGTVNNWTPSGFVAGVDSIVDWASLSTDLTVTGLIAGTAGQIVLIKNRGTHVLYLAHLSGSSSAANQFENVITSGLTPIGPRGWAYLKYNGATNTWNLFGHEQGAWIDIAYSAGDYTGSGAMTWTVDSGDVKAHCYKVSGKSLIVQIYIDTSTIGGTPDTEVRVANPNGYTWTRTQLSICHSVNTTASGASLSGTVASQTYVRGFVNFTGSNWAAGAGNDTYFRTQIEAEVN